MSAAGDDDEAIGIPAQPAEGGDNLPPPSEGSPTPASVSGLKEDNVNPLAPPTIVEAGS